MTPHIVGLAWGILCILINLPLSPLLTILIWVFNITGAVYYTLVCIISHDARKGELNNELELKLLKDAILPDLLTGGIFSIYLSSVFFIFSTVGSIGVMEYLFMVAGFVNFLFFCETSLHIYLEYMVLLKAYIEKNK